MNLSEIGRGLAVAIRVGIISERLPYSLPMHYLHYISYSGKQNNKLTVKKCAVNKESMGHHSPTLGVLRITKRNLNRWVTNSSYKSGDFFLSTKHI